MPYNRGMNPYTTERWPLERHEELVRQAELLARLVPAPRRTVWSAWLAARLRGVADRLDGCPRTEPGRPMVIRSFSEPAP